MQFCYNYSVLKEKTPNFVKKTGQVGQTGQNRTICPKSGHSGQMGPLLFIINLVYHIMASPYLLKNPNQV